MASLYSRLKTQIAVAPTRVAVERSFGLHGADAEQMCATFEALNLGGFWSTDAAGRIGYLSAGLLAALVGDSDAAGRDFVTLFVRPRAGIDGQRTLPFVFARKGRFEAVIARSELDEREIVWSVSGEPIVDGDGEFAGFRGHIVDVTRDRQSAEEASQLATTDALTGLLNRRHMTNILKRTFAAFAPQRRPCAVMLIDLDRFKQVNDTLGHAVGDTLLKQVAQRLIKVVGDKDRICRLGGDEFQVMFPDVEDRGRLGDVAGRIITMLSEPYTIEGNRCTIGTSVGIAVSPYDGETADDVVRNADLALYAAKHSGRGRFRFYSNEMLESAEQRRHLEETMHDALIKGEFELHYQPLVDLASNRVVGTEALVRWNHPESGLISPALFIPIAEESTMICRIGEWILRKACEDAARWPGRVRVAVNVSPVQFADPQFPRIVATVLMATGLDPDRLELELTESVFLQEGEATDAMFKSLKGLGVRLVLDDFGTGYSSLSYLKNAPFDKIKIDQSFVRGATSNDNRNRAIISAIVALANALGMDTIAEGVETFDQLDMVRDLKIGMVQGYIYSKPVRVEHLFVDLPDEEWVIEPEGPAKQRHERRAMFRTIGVIHEDHYYPVTLRNLSQSGALIEGLLDVPIGTPFMVDFGEGQFELATVVRSRESSQGISFARDLVSDGNGGLCTRHRFMQHHLVAAGVPRNTEEFLTKQAGLLASGKISLPCFSVANRKARREQALT
ncbi:bifunctional diguanylate cyclase/phosphodiesterase [Novosphingobium sp. FSW06-99]|uniref:putative bifunctional diguanylate cyclase/phosphodiesterase n=1 Tax=Novosphingobium sp. FSW06-99 TaxID=1739113 RepID=UPI000AC2D17F|nr:EAL domain-containing protein [Novosphingobium sp. FSW06-99]